MNIFFDLDGPILDVSTRYYRVYADILRGMNAEPISPSEYWDAKRRSVPDAEILACSGVQDRTQEFQAHRIDIIETAKYLAMDTVWSGIHEFLSTISTRHDLTIVTLRRSRSQLLKELEDLKLSGYFTGILSDPAIGTSKPDTKIRLVREYTNGAPLRGWFIGDTQTDILSGKGLGLSTCAVTFGIRVRAAFEQLNPDLVVDSPAELITELGGRIKEQ